jgi:hypothetical protein
MALSQLMQERKIGADITGMYNRAGMQMEGNLAGMPTFGSNLAYGLGSAAAIPMAYGAAQRWAQGMTGGYN